MQCVQVRSHSHKSVSRHWIHSPLLRASSPSIAISITLRLPLFTLAREARNQGKKDDSFNCTSVNGKHFIRFSVTLNKIMLTLKVNLSNPLLESHSLFYPSLWYLILHCTFSSSSHSLSLATLFICYMIFSFSLPRLLSQTLNPLLIWEKKRRKEREEKI